LSWEGLREIGELAVYDRTAAEDTVARAAAADIVPKNVGQGAVSRVYVREMMGIVLGGLVFYQVKSLTAIESKLLVAGKKRHVLGDGMGNNDVVAGVVVVHRLVERETGVSEHGTL